MTDDQSQDVEDDRGGEQPERKDDELLVDRMPRGLGVTLHGCPLDYEDYELDVPIVRQRSVLVEIAQIVEDDARSITTVVDQVELVVAIINGRSTGAEGHAPSYRSKISYATDTPTGASVFDSRRGPAERPTRNATGWWT